MLQRFERLRRKPPVASSLHHAGETSASAFASPKTVRRSTILQTWARKKERAVPTKSICNHFVERELASFVRFRINPSDAHVSFRSRRQQLSHATDLGYAMNPTQYVRSAGSRSVCPVAISRCSPQPTVESVTSSLFTDCIRAFVFCVPRARFSRSARAARAARANASVANSRTQPCA
jgi:hypothetical protein